MSDTAETLCKRAGQGDQAAATELVSRFYERLYAWFRRLTGNDQDAADLTQKTFARAWASLASFAGRSSYSTWLHGIGHHVYVDWRRRSPSTECRPDAWWEACAQDEPGPSETSADRETAHQLYALVDQLDEAIRQTVHLHYYEGFSLAETAAVLGVATSTVKYRLRQALQFLRGHLAEPSPSRS
jgi:RNA polymerase sigma-70 factor, ECF subfamily